MEGEIVSSSALARSEPSQLSGRARLSAVVLKEEVEQRQLLGQYVKACMVEGADFGKIPGTDKPTLLKPGAEKLVALFHCEPRFELVKDQCVTDFEKGFFKYTFRCSIVGPNGAVLAEGYGSANSREARYRWRTAKRSCPSCGSNAALLTSKQKGGGFFCWAKKGGCGATFAEGDTRITNQQLGRVENEDIADLDNTILKMAKKRAQVDGAIALARCSDMFTQDLEDHADDEAGAPEPTPAAVVNFPEKPKAVPPAEPKAEPLAPAEPVVGFGPNKARKLAELADNELLAAAEFAQKKLASEPNATWAPTLKVRLAAVEAEAARRGFSLVTREPGEDDVPF